MRKVDYIWLFTFLLEDNKQSDEVIVKVTQVPTKLVDCRRMTMLSRGSNHGITRGDTSWGFGWVGVLNRCESAI